MPDAVPGSIIGRFGEGRFGEFRGGHITDHDQLLPAIYDAVRAGNLTFQTKVDAKVQMSDRLVCISDFALKIDVPASTGIVGKAPSLDGALDWAREPHAEAMSVVGDRVVFQTDVGGLEGNSAERALPTTLFQLDLLTLPASCDVLGTHLLDGIGR